ncbi:YcaO-like family protein [Pararhizobium sp. LjRoot235]|uniref:YcaO-like family protein n=1 Tax=Pararhizobium sp. LjRoot235 TaxID=3342291 RepID=UPI003ECCE194
MLRAETGAIPVFGFSCASSHDRAEMIAKYECIEHLWSHPNFYSQRDLKAELAVRSFSNKCEIGTIERGQLLLGAKDHNGHPRNATGLALGSQSHDPVQHAVHEVIERHCLACWWQQRSLCLKTKELTIDGGRLQALLVREIAEEYLAVKIDIDIDVPSVSIGSAYRSLEEDAVTHAIEEATMLRFVLQENTQPSKRHDILRTQPYAIAVIGIVREILEREDKEEAFYMPDINYSTVYDRAGLELTRAYSPNALDPAFQNNQIPSPFL